jgi:VWFA-related protein
MNGLVRGLAACAIVAAAAAVIAQAPTSPASQPPRPTFRTEANYVRVDAFPTRNGAPVTDLTRDDFEILDNGQPQTIEQFERIEIRAAGPQDTRIEPNTVRESRAMLDNPRARVFVLFLDTYHVDVAASRNIRKPLVNALDRALGPEDLIGVMTPEMSPNDIAFARKTTTIDGLLERYWHWGERDRLNAVDPEDNQYWECYPNVSAGDRCADQNGVAQEMIDRRHEKRALDAMQDLVRSLRGLREERKAILAISNGWLLFRPNGRLQRVLACEGVPTGLPRVSVDPRNGRPTTQAPPGTANASRCQIDRQNLAQIDDDQLFRDILDEANRANASFYPIDPRGLAVFDTPIMRQGGLGPAPPITPPSVDSAMLRGRLNALRTLGEATDGIAIVQTNDLDGGLRRVVNDLSSYYLLGYYSTSKLDGKFHKITVRVKRPGVDVRARRGYLAATEAAAARTARDAGASAPTPAEAEALAMESVLRPLGSFSRETSLRLRAAAGWTAANTPRVWVVGELGSGDAWRLGSDAEIELSHEGQTLASAHVNVPTGQRSFRVELAPTAPLAPGDYTINVRSKATSLLATTSDMVPLPLPAAPANYGSLIVRKGPYTGLKEVPTADLRFRRSEQMRVEVPARGTEAPAARLLDRNGKPMSAVPMTATVREDPDGTRWYVTQVPLFPLGPGDYIVEVSAGSVKTLTPFRIVQ